MESGDMTDLIEQAQDQADKDLAAALAYRKPVATRCEVCKAPAMILPNGARCRFCESCLANFREARA